MQLMPCNNDLARFHVPSFRAQPKRTPADRPNRMALRTVRLGEGAAPLRARVVRRGEGRDEGYREGQSARLHGCSSDVRGSHLTTRTEHLACRTIVAALEPRR